MRTRLALAAATFTAVLTMIAGVAPASLAVPFNLPITVTNVNDSGSGSLRAAILRANSRPGPDTISFAVPGAGPHVITPLTDLPPITDPVIVDGYTQAGALAATTTSPAVLMVVLDAQNLTLGLDLQSSDSHISGLVIHSGAIPTGKVRISGDRNRVTGSYLGTDPTGIVPLLNSQGVEIDGDNNVIGGSAAADMNVIGADLDGVIIIGGQENEIIGNLIGTTADGTASLGGAAGFAISYGVMIEHSDGNVVRNNLISGWFVGVEVWSDQNVIQGNLIGTDITGGSVIGNGLGLNLEGGDYNQVGGRIGSGNVVSGNEYGGIRLETGADGSADGNIIQGNLIGTDITGKVAVPNGVGFSLPGVSIANSSGNLIGGSEPGIANVISGNEGDGIEILGTTTADGNVVQGNKIGTDIDGVADLGNGGSGVDVDGGDDTQIGGTDAGTGNVIAFNAADGVTIRTGVDNTVIRNSIWHNGGLPIDLDDDGPTANDGVPDADLGANTLLNYPIVTAMAAAGTIDWTLETAPGIKVRIDFYSADCGLSGIGHAVSHLGSVSVITDANGLASASTPMPSGGDVVATTTAFTNGAPGSTSELSRCAPVP